MRLSPAAGDLVEDYAKEWSKVVGFAYSGCPWRTFSDPFVAAVTRAMPLYKSGQLEVAYPDGVPHALLEGCRAYESLVNGVTNTDQRERSKKRTQEREKQTEFARLKKAGTQ